MELVKKTHVWFHWRLSTKLFYRGGETLGEIREEEEGKRKVTLQGEKRSLSASFF